MRPWPFSRFLPHLSPPSPPPPDTPCSAMQFCPDPGYAKLAVAQSDGIVFVYKWSSSPKGGDRVKAKAGSLPPPSSSASIWTGKKSICNKFPEPSAVTCLVWPPSRGARTTTTPNKASTRSGGGGDDVGARDVVYGLADGSVRIGNLRSNRSKTLYYGRLSPSSSTTTTSAGDDLPSPSPVASLACRPGGGDIWSRGRINIPLRLPPRPPRRRGRRPDRSSSLRTLRPLVGGRIDLRGGE